MSVCFTCMHIYACMYVCVFRTRPRWQRFASFCSPEPRLVPACSLCLARIFLPTRECLEKVVDFSVNKALRFLISLKLSLLRARALSLSLSPSSFSFFVYLSHSLSSHGSWRGWVAQTKFAGEREDNDDVYDYIGETRNSSRPSSARRYLPCRGDGERNRETMVCIRIPCQKYRDATQTRGVTPK